MGDTFTFTRPSWIFSEYLDTTAAPNVIPVSTLPRTLPLPFAFP